MQIYEHVVYIFVIYYLILLLILFFITSLFWISIYIHYIIYIHSYITEHRYMSPIKCCLQSSSSLQVLRNWKEVVLSICMEMLNIILEIIAIFFFLIVLRAGCKIFMTCPACAHELNQVARALASGALVLSSAIHRSHGVYRTKSHPTRDSKCGEKRWPELPWDFSSAWV